MFKKLLSLFLSVGIMLCLSACGKNDTQVKQKENEKVKYDETQILFRAQDNCNIEDDRNVFYNYNYKGERINTNEETSRYFYGKNGLAPAAHPQSGKVGFVNKDGEFVIDPKYDDASIFSKDGLAPVCVEAEETYREKWGFVNSKGEEVVPLIYDDVTCFFDSGYAVIGTYRNDEDRVCRYGIIDKKGNVILKPQYVDIIYIFDKYFFCVLEGGEAAIVNFKGNIIAKEDENTAYTIGSEKYNEYKIYKYDITRDEDDEIVSYKYISTFNGKDFIEEKSDCEISSKNVATTYTGLGYGVTKDEKTVIPFEYDEIVRYNSYFAAIKYLSDNGYEQTIDIYDMEFNKTAENLEYAFSRRTNPYGVGCMLPDGYFEIRLDNDDYEWVNGIIDYKGNIIVEPVFGRGIILNTYEGVGKFGRY